MSQHISRSRYASIYGPTTGDRVRLGDTNLIARIERDFTTYGDECKFGGGKVLRDRMGQAAVAGCGSLRGKQTARRADYIRCGASLAERAFQCRGTRVGRDQNGRTWRAG
jgi:hypothetical protein